MDKIICDICKKEIVEKSLCLCIRGTRKKWLYDFQLSMGPELPVLRGVGKPGKRMIGRIQKYIRFPRNKEETLHWCDFCTQRAISSFLRSLVGQRKVGVVDLGPKKD